MEMLRFHTQCTDKDGQIGCFLTDMRTGRQLTKCFKSCTELIESKEYQEIKKDYEDNKLGTLETLKKIKPC